MPSSKQTITMKALVGGDSGQYSFSDNVNVPAIRPGTMLCRVVAVALNPFDAKITQFSVAPGAIAGNDFSGDVIEIGRGVTRFAPGDRVLGMAFGLNPIDASTGAFASFALATEDLACRIPSSMSYEEASSMGLGIGTAGTSLFQRLQLPLPDPDRHATRLSDVPVLVSGGATATGALAIQLLRCAGLEPIATCSPSSNSYVRSLGAVACFDYHSPTCGADIRLYTKNRLAHVFDCVTDAVVMKMCYEAIGSAGGTYVALEPLSTTVQYSRRDVRASWLMALSLFGDVVRLPGAYGRPATAVDREFAALLFPLVESLLHNGCVKNHPVHVRKGDLGSLKRGIEELRVGLVRGEKLVYTLPAED
ncbi:hypothetical protein S7711_05842 [Stachybotrys chartarum IBT 7711]|uniref:Enoyl reductase (ER) domain-containing protein n=1 Tax=Stachybotrys chartarum (strain CBS 109288 / IBT 7711) TaxID=1280523 RepID=A0A084AM80_STACB|nr:hypothetical protein S7711_05842 [Stachybotrys chartarum IBT 7711]